MSLFVTTMPAQKARRISMRSNTSPFLMLLPRFANTYSVAVEEEEGSGPAPERQPRCFQLETPAAFRLPSDGQGGR